MVRAPRSRLPPARGMTGWQELTDPVSCGYTGPSAWHRDHLGPALRELRASTGPFAGCTKGEHQINHRMPALVPSVGPALRTKPPRAWHAPAWREEGGTEGTWPIAAMPGSLVPGVMCCPLTVIRQKLGPIPLPIGISGWLRSGTPSSRGNESCGGASMYAPAEMRLKRN
ncbi:DUF4913 domain-containing protein [Streptomyces paradoxus]|uniref:DUF4913 domain-containing protein n=1 Tax=Streptomyces paradoxus TaxID=66375 RepID=UPI0037FD5C1A